MPQLGESVDQGTITKWLVKPGTRVTQFDAIVEVETDKVSTEIPAPATGTIQVLLAKEGAVVQIGAEIAILEVEEAVNGVDVPSTGGPPSDGRAASGTNASAPFGAFAGPALGSEPNAQQQYSPAVLELARANQIDLSQVTGSGEGGRVTRRDVLRVIEAHHPLTGNARTVADQTLIANDGDERVPLSRVRRLIAENMTLSKSTIPHAWQTQEIDMSGVLANKQANKDRFDRREGFSLTFLPYVISAAIAGLRQHRLVNATFMPDHVVLHRAINIGIAIGLRDGVVVPVIRNADGLSVAGVARAANDLATRARAKKLMADDLEGGTFTVNNSGTFGTVLSYSVINSGQAGILTMEAIKDRVVAVDGVVEIRPMMFLCFSLDHRILDGLEAARFLSTCREWLEGVTAETPID
jgi:2-oxoisovalerate dehydrogenase E2 component (dihydrolipoyl transacylase)